LGLAIWRIWVVGGRGGGGRLKADYGFAAGRGFRFAAGLRLAVLGV